MTIRGNFVAENLVVVQGDIDTGYNVVIREASWLGNGVKIWSNTVIDAECFIGHNVRIHCNCYLAQRTVVEDNVFIGPGVTITNDKYPIRPKEHWSPVIIKQGAKIGGGVVLLPGVIIGENALIGAGSVVTKSVPAGETWAGNPARKMNSNEQG